MLLSKNGRDTLERFSLKFLMASVLATGQVLITKSSAKWWPLRQTEPETGMMYITYLYNYNSSLT